MILLARSILSIESFSELAHCCYDHTKERAEANSYIIMNIA